MPLQSSFLIRCWLDSLDATGTVKRYQIEHVQTGQQLHFADFDEMHRWMTEVNRQFLAEAIFHPGEAEA